MSHSPFPHANGPLGLNYDSDDDSEDNMQVDSDDEVKHDVDAEGESIDEDTVTPVLDGPSSLAPVAGPSSHRDSVSSLWLSMSLSYTQCHTVLLVGRR